MVESNSNTEPIIYHYLSVLGQANVTTLPETKWALDMNTEFKESNHGRI